MLCVCVLLPERAVFVSVKVRQKKHWLQKLCEGKDQMFLLMSWIWVQWYWEILERKYQGPQVQLFPLHNVMKFFFFFFFLRGGCCNSLEENESQILKGLADGRCCKFSTQCYKYVQEHSLEHPCINLWVNCGNKVCSNYTWEFLCFCRTSWNVYITTLYVRQCTQHYIKENTFRFQQALKDLWVEDLFHYQN